MFLSLFLGKYGIIPKIEVNYGIQIISKNLLPSSTTQRTWITHSGGAIKSFLSEHSVYFNGELENRRGKKLRIGDKVDIPDMNIDIF